ncbi:MAG: photosystem I reaction center subunit PsaK [Cyanobacteria bacterium QH_8_48_120]|nr:MAG: photosystem I reaction center subunit PsaK [Cyanobacteria bacterium QH_1_48_107]PSO60213.1 MAG: photosystem I reaction center subunit PsaK [Cyanobacteria bacterium QH_10_48_56]PSO62949.1 MAG: photosystem I reaction center subunit PsaK [Cyanobacteria bacterium QH_6_48_35]PSO66507.1 MAG: photosystem I reaction center subunit PsaK [Cyanobacteria bacterium QH_2_48_84]PSO68053.1 MAG: photosystem I reaction center subunit PsaK [Cyanobacteria bacterium QH_7_48_89]PSO69311.1 MAG: photosystem I
MTPLTLLAQAQSTVPHTPEWSSSVALIMITCNVLAVIIGRFAIRNPGRGPALPLASGILGGFGVPELIATTSFGHVIGAGVILGLGNAGIL